MGRVLTVTHLFFRLIKGGFFEMQKLMLNFSAFLMLFLILGCGKSPKIIAKVGNESITVDEYKTHLMRQKRGQDINSLSFEERKEALQPLIDERTKIVRAYELGFDQKPEFVKDIEQRTSRLAAQKLSEIEIVDKIINEKMSKSFFDIMGRKLKIAVVALGFKGIRNAGTDRSKEEAIQLGKEIVNRIKHGEDIIVLSNKYSYEPTVKKKKGIIEPYRAGLFDPKLDVEIAKARKGQVIGPISSEKGVFILKILEDTPLKRNEDYANTRKKIKWQILSRFYKQRGDSLFKKLSEQFRTELGSSISEAGIEKFLKILDTFSTQTSFHDSSLTSKQRDIHLAQIGSINVTVGYFVDQFRGGFYRSYLKFKSKKAMEKNLNDYMSNYLSWILMAKKRNLEQNPNIVAEIERYKISKLSQIFDQYEINPNIVPSEAEIQTYYEANKEKFKDPAKIRIWEIALKDEKKAQQIYQRALKRKTDFPDLASQYTEKISMRKRKGDLGFQNENSTRKIVKKAFEAGPNKIIGPIQERNYYYIIKTGEMKPSRIKPFEEVKLLAKGNAQREKRNRIQQALLAQLQQQYHVWINETLLKKLS